MARVPRLAVLCALALALISCSGQEAAPNSSNSTSTSTSSSGFVVPTPAAGSGVVTGKLINQRGQEAAKPLAGAPLYLGTTLKSTTGVEGMVELDKGTAPKAFADAQGNFVFANVPPGRYGLMLDTPQGAILLNKPVTGENLLVNVEDGKTVDMGELHYNIDIEYTQ